MSEQAERIEVQESEDASSVAVAARPLKASEARVIALAERILDRHMQRGVRFTCPEDSARYLCMRLAGEPDEVFGAVFLDARNRVLRCEALFHGTLDGAAVFPRTLVRRVLELNAAGCVLWHNHPSGDPTPSRNDEVITQRVNSALELVDARVVDHLIVAGTAWVSLAERGLV